MTATNEVIERAAGAIYDASGQPLCGVDKYSDHIHAAAYEKCAHDALSTLRPGDRLPNGLVVVPMEPSGDMVEVGRKAADMAYDQCLEYIFSPGEHREYTDACTVIYRAMLSALEGK